MENGPTLHLNKLESPSPKDALCQVWLKLALWFWRRRWKCENFTTTTRKTTTTTTNNRQILNRKAHLSPRLRWARKCKDFSVLVNSFPSSSVLSAKSISVCLGLSLSVLFKVYHSIKKKLECQNLFDLVVVGTIQFYFSSIWIFNLSGISHSYYKMSYLPGY